MSRKEEVLDELVELDVDQHPLFYKNEPRGRKRYVDLLIELNALDKKQLNAPME